ncbi:MAG: DUF4198 domain-containing protein [Alphaproteobacteria bacterium]
MTRLLGAAALVPALHLPATADAHRAWLLPSATVLSGGEPWVTVDAAISNDLFYFEHNPMRLDGLQIVAPDGSREEAQNRGSGKFRNTFDVRLVQPGTYKLAVVADGLFARYEENGETKRWRGTAQRLAEIPETAQNLQLAQSQSRTEAFVTAGKPSTAALKPSGIGLELEPVTHPNDLIAGEASRFRLLLDGKPAGGVNVMVIQGGIRYRDQLNETKLSTDSEGHFEFVWPAPGMYWLNASIQDDRSTITGARRRASYTATLEVLPP